MLPRHLDLNRDWALRFSSRLYVRLRGESLLAGSLPTPSALYKNSLYSCRVIERSRDIRRDLISRVLDRIRGQMRIPRRCLHLSVAEQFADHR
jgi:hypothetical protein